MTSYIQKKEGASLHHEIGIAHRPPSSAPLQDYFLYSYELSVFLSFSKNNDNHRKTRPLVQKIYSTFALNSKRVTKVRVDEKVAS